MDTGFHILLALAPGETFAPAPGVIPAYAAYYLGSGPHLYRTAGVPRGGYLLADDRALDVRGEGAAVAREIVRECSSRGFRGVILRLCARPGRLAGQIVGELAPLLSQRGLPLLVPEEYARYAPSARVLVSSAVTAGSLRRRLQDACAAYGRERVVLAAEVLAVDLTVSAPAGQGTDLTARELEHLRTRYAPAVFFSDALCARYFTYLSRKSGAHYVLFDDADTLRQKLRTARTLGVDTAVLNWSEAAPFWDALR